jgi:serine/threonine protein kinase
MNCSSKPSSANLSHTSFRYEDFTDQVDLGRGTFGFVEKGRWGNSTVAIKYLHDSSELHAELDNLKRVYGGEHIVGFYGLIANEHGQTGIVMEYCSRGTLQDYMASNFLQFGWDNKLNMAQEIANGLQFVHQQGLSHRNLHDRNILIDDGGHALITDFGFAGPIDRDDMERCVAFLPPERLGDERRWFTVQGDVYSLGSILWELTAGRQPFYGMTYLAVSKAVLNGERENPISGTPEWYRELYTNCWATDPMGRPNLDHISQHLTQRGWCCAVSMFPCSQHAVADPHIDRY